MKKKIIIILIIGLFIIALLTIAEIKISRTKILKNYHKFIETSKTTYLYNSNHQKIGTISKGIKFPLAKLNKKSKYYQIKNSKFYLLYKDVKKSSKLELIKNPNYLPLSKKIKNKPQTILYQNNKKAIILNKELSFQVDFIKDNYYYITFLNNQFTIKKNKQIKEIKQKNTIKNNVEVLNYETIAKSCLTSDCTPIKNFKLQIDTLLKNGYYTITNEEYDSFMKNNLNLKPKALLITTATKNADLISLEKDLNINIEEKITAQEINNIKRYSSIENILKMAQGENIIETIPNYFNNQTIPVLNYHFFYDPKLNESCNESICLTTDKFKEHLSYLKDNGYKALTIEEFKSWMYNELELPEKSVLITIDDGAMGTGKHNGNKLIPLLEEYQMPATLFLITGWWNLDNYISPYLDVQSHTFDMHQYGTCGRGQVNCEPYEKVKADLQKSIDILGRNESFCFPFYYSSEQSLKAVKETGFQLAFVGGNKKASRNSDKFQIPRYPIQSNITLNQFINIVN